MNSKADSWMWSMWCCAGPGNAGDDTPEDAETSEHSSSGASRRDLTRGWPAAPSDSSSFSMTGLRAKAESLKASANMADLRASANKTSKQYATSILQASSLLGFSDPSLDDIDSLRSLP